MGGKKRAPALMAYPHDLIPPMDPYHMKVSPPSHMAKQRTKPLAHEPWGTQRSTPEQTSLLSLIFILPINHMLKIHEKDLS